MYYFIYDSFLTDRRHHRTMAAIETRLTDLGLSGRIGRLNAFTNARGLVRDETRKGARTIVVVGNDETVAKVVSGIGEADVTLGIIPVGQPNEIAKSLGIPEGEEACEVLSRRVTQKVDLGRVNGQLFLSEVRVPAAECQVEIERSYQGSDYRFQLQPQGPGCEVVVSNLRGFTTPALGTTKREPGDPQDGLLDALVVPSGRTFLNQVKNRLFASSLVPVTRLTVRSQQEDGFEAFVDTVKTKATEMVIEVAPARLKIITGRERVFGGA
jgi:hypothetical protein